VCPGFVDRTVWDGDQIIAEQRSSGLDVVTGGAPNFGTVRYVHLLGIDAPVAILDNRFSDARVIHYNWRGLAEASSWSNGNPADEELGVGIKVAWPAGQGVYLKKGNNPNVGQDVTWIGSLPANGQGDAGLVYRRNRYYDPASGRFTQEDPIGIAGGMNLYGFAGGDPVNYTDPFGLDTTYVACRPVGGDNRSEAEQSSDGHCAVRVSNSRRGDNAMAEIVREGTAASVRVGTFGPESEQFARYGDMWEPVAVPEGMTEEEFDAKVLREIYTQSRFYNGAPYWPGGEGNSNSFIYRVITGAGGKVPAAASAHIKRVPGICGGSGLKRGNNCAP
jgi:RHS repeat-associated protein